MRSATHPRQRFLARPASLKIGQAASRPHQPCVALSRKQCEGRVEGIRREPSTNIEVLDKSIRNHAQPWPRALAVSGEDRPP